MNERKESDVTAGYKKKYYILTAISWAIVFGPLLGYIIYGYIVSNTIQKVTLSTTIVAAIVLTVISILFKKKVRSTVFILILGIYVAISKIQVLIIIMCFTTMLDEFLVTPLQRSMKEKLTINREMDKRFDPGEEG